MKLRHLGDSQVTGRGQRLDAAEMEVTPCCHSLPAVRLFPSQVAALTMLTLVALGDLGLEAANCHPQEPGFGVRLAWVEVLTLPHPRSVTLGNFPYLSQPQFLQL